MAGESCWLIAMHHYLGYSGFAGAQLRYLVESERGVIAALGFASSAWKCASRDAHIGWDAPTREARLHLVVIDELALYLVGGDRKARERLADSFRDLIAPGRAAGVIVLAATQRPSSDIVPTSLRNLFG
jgi:hypothetical protein